MPRRPTPPRSRAPRPRPGGRAGSFATAGAALLAVAVTACSGPPDGADPAGDGAAAAETTADGTWTVLFDGTDLSAWRGYGRDDVPAAWRIEDGVLALVPGDGEGGDLVTRDTWGDFELALEWRISEGGNSGVFYRATEDEPWIYQSAPEMQVLDDERHADGESPLTSAGANFGLDPVTVDATRPVGEWNAARIVARGPRIEHWLNGTKVVEYELWSPDWENRVAESKFAAWPAYGRAAEGHIGLQDHGDRVWYRNVRIRRLGGDGS